MYIDLSDFIAVLTSDVSALVRLAKAEHSKTAPRSAAHEKVVSICLCCLNDLTTAALFLTKHS